MAAEEDVGYSIPVQATRATDIRVSKTDIERYGITGGCPACKYLIEGKKIGSGVAHNTECRKRIKDLIKESDDVKDRVSRAEKRKQNVSKPPEVLKHVSKIGRTHVKGPKHLSKLTSELNAEMLNLVTSGMDVAEIYSPPRIACKATEMGLRGGWSLDLTTTDVDGNRWDFYKL